MYLGSDGQKMPPCIKTEVTNKNPEENVLFNHVTLYNIFI